MDEQKDMLALLDMMVQPVFCVRDSILIRANAAAAALLPPVGESILPLLDGCEADYRAFREGCLCLPLRLAGQPLGACVHRMGDTDVFVTVSDTDSSVLRALALAACALRRPLSGAMAGTSALLDSHADPEMAAQLAQINRSLYQILRTLGNMSDMEFAGLSGRMETAEVAAFFRDVFEKASLLLAHSNIRLTYQGPDAPLFCLADTQQLERALLNLLANAGKFSSAGGQIDATLTRRGDMLQLTVQDNGSGMARDVMSGLFQRYLRQPGIEDSRFGLGLGIRLAHAAALNHGGTLLISPGEAGGTRVVMTLAIRRKEGCSLRSPIMPMDYTGGFDHCLVELSDCLPASLFDGNF